jgi:hypothetical protein
MAMIFKNYTTEDVVIVDLGEATIPAEDQKDLVTDLNLKIPEIALSDDLMALLGEGTAKYVINNGERDLGLSDGMKYVLNVNQLFPMVDEIPKMRADSRPPHTQNYFCERGDDPTTWPHIGNGKIMAWDWSNTDDDITNADYDAIDGEYDPDPWPYKIPTGMKRKRIVVKFGEGIYLKEGTLYFYGVSFGSYVDLSIVCPQGQYYYNRVGVPTLAEDGPVIVSRYCTHLQMKGDCPMGDEFNSEGCTERAIPQTYEWWIEVTVPTADESSQGYVELELYRPRTVLFPGEDLA